MNKTPQIRGTRTIIAVISVEKWVTVDATWNYRWIKGPKVNNKMIHFKEACIRVYLHEQTKGILK